MTSSFEKPKMKPSDLSMSVMSAWSPNASDSVVVSSRPPKPAPSTSIRIDLFPPRGGPPGGSTAPGTAWHRLLAGGGRHVLVLALVGIGRGLCGLDREARQDPVQPTGEPPVGAAEGQH